MQSIDYEILDYYPPGKKDIKNIQNCNPVDFWTSTSDSITLNLSLESTVIKEISICVNAESSCQIVSEIGHNPVSVYEGNITIKKSNKFCTTIFPVLQDPLTQLKFSITTLTQDNLIIYSIILKSNRESEAPKNKTYQSTLSSHNFYSTNKSPKPIVNSQTKQEPFYKSPPLTKTPEQPKKNSELSISKLSLLEDYKKPKQKTLNFSPETRPNCSYQNLMSDKGNYIVTCLEEEEGLRSAIAEICNITGICYLRELEDITTHIIYSGDDPMVFEKASEHSVKIVSKNWIFDLIKKREALDPSPYERLFGR